jgi:hypothetical protein
LSAVEKIQDFSTTKYITATEIVIMHDPLLRSLIQNARLQKKSCVYETAKVAKKAGIPFVLLPQPKHTTFCNVNISAGVQSVMGWTDVVTFTPKTAQLVERV